MDSWSMKTIAGSMLSIMCAGLLGFIWSLFVDLKNVEARVIVIKGTQSEIVKKVDDIHWYLIKRNNVHVPGGK